MRLVERYGAIVAASRWMKSKMPWPPASVPVMKSDHATGLCAGMAVPRAEKPPIFARRDRPGSRPSFINRVVRS